MIRTDENLRMRRRGFGLPAAGVPRWGRGSATQPPAQSVRPWRFSVLAAKGFMALAL